jgi:peptidase MA superfamily protein/tetratricopeptide repeat protein
MLAVASPATAQGTQMDPHLLAGKGAVALENRRFGDALTVFTEAATLLRHDSSVCFGAGIAAFMLGQNDDARAWFERALAVNPTYLPPAEWLGELHYRAGRLQEAISVYETALERSPGAQKLAVRLIEWRKESDLENRFSKTRGPHFSVLFEKPADEPIARRVVDRLEAAYTRVGASLDAYPAQPITAVLYTREQFDGITRLAEWSAAGYDGRIRVPLALATEQTEELDRVLVHEVAHAVVAALGGRTVPAWMDEGLATLLEPGGAEDAEATLTRTTVRPPLRQLHRRFVGLAASEAEVAYACSTRAVRRLIELGGTPALVLLLQDLARGAQFESAFQKRFAIRYEDFAAMVTRD